MSHRILLVDDEVDILVREGYEVFTAENGAEALKVAAECRPHLILLDMMMPVMDGAQTCRAIRRNPVLKDTMVVFLSALGEEGQQLAGFDVGADDPRRTGDHPPAQGVRAAGPAPLVAREADSPRGDLRQDLGHGGRRGRPHDRRAHPQAAPEDRRRTHRHGQGRGI